MFPPHFAFVSTLRERLLLQRPSPSHWHFVHFDHFDVAQLAAQQPAWHISFCSVSIVHLRQLDLVRFLLISPIPHLAEHLLHGLHSPGGFFAQQGSQIFFGAQGCVSTRVQSSPPALASIFGARVRCCAPTTAVPLILQSSEQLDHADHGP